MQRRDALSLLAASPGLSLAATGDAPRRETGWTPARPFDIEKPWPWITPSRRTAIRLHPEITAQPLPLAASKTGGTFLWPAKEPWPFCRERDYFEMPAQTWEQAITSAREMKLIEGLAVHLSPKTGNRQQDLANFERDAKRSEQLYEKRRAQGLPQLTATELDETRKQFEENKQLAAKMRLPHNTPYLALVQLRRDEFPELPWPGASDLFQLLWCHHLHLEGNGGTDPDQRPRQSAGMAIRWRIEKLIGPTLAQQPKPVEAGPLPECALHPEEIAEYPPAEHFAPEQIDPHLRALAPWFASAPKRSNRAVDDPDALSWRYSREIAAAPGTKLLGYPNWIQNEDTPDCPACGQEMRLLLTCASMEEEEDPIWTHPSRRKQASRHASHMWGDAGNAYVFYCARRHPMRIASLIQSS